MKKLITWLITIEDLATIFYSDAAAYFHKDEELSAFLRQFAKDEAWHSNLMVTAAEYEAAGNMSLAGIELDDDTRTRIENSFVGCRKQMEAGVCPTGMLLDCIATTEYSEWNHIFLYVVNTLKGYSQEFGKAAAKINQHKKQLERFLEGRPEGGACLEKIRGLPAVWEEKILIVDDHPAIREFFADILSPEGEVVTAVSGNEGLERMAAQYFDVILCDMQMPVMDGMEFYRQASKKDPGLGDRILFLTGNPSAENLAFFRKNNLRFFMKPVPIQDLQEAVRDIIHSTRTKPLKS
jgi:CheY-like chemotaxis protein